MDRELFEQFGLSREAHSPGDRCKGSVIGERNACRAADRQPKVMVECGEEFVSGEQFVVRFLFQRTARLKMLEHRDRRPVRKNHPVTPTTPSASRPPLLWQEGSCGCHPSFVRRGA